MGRCRHEEGRHCAVGSPSRRRPGGRRPSSGTCREGGDLPPGRVVGGTTGGAGEGSLNVPYGARCRGYSYAPTGDQFVSWDENKVLRLFVIVLCAHQVCSGIHDSWVDYFCVSAGGPQALLSRSTIVVTQKSWARDWDVHRGVSRAPVDRSWSPLLVP